MMPRTYVWLAIVSILPWLVLPHGKSRANPRSAECLRIRGPGLFEIQIVDGGDHADAFRKVLGRKAGTDGELIADAILRWDDHGTDGAQVVGIYVKGHELGQLPEETARLLRATLRRDGHAGRRECAVAARIHGGGARHRFSMRLDLPEA